MSFEGSIFGLNKKIIDAASMGANISSEVVDIAEFPGYCVHAIWSAGSPVGSIVVSGSNDGSDFVTVSTVSAGGAAGQLLLNVEKAHYRYVHVNYARTSDTGTLNCYISAKRI